MNASLKRIYDAASPGVRNVMASAYGLQARYWRYGAHTDRWAREALERDAWSAEAWDEWRAERLARVLERAATQVPYYREHWRQRRREGDTRSWARLENWPVLPKDEVRRDPRAFLADDAPRRLQPLHTSGSTGTPVTTWRSRRTMQHWYALMEARWRGWYGVSRFDRWAMLGGKLVVPFAQEAPPYWVWNAGLNQLYLSTFHLKPETAEAYVGAMHRARVTWMYGYASSMYALAHAVLEQGLRPPALHVAVSNAEPLRPHQRDAIERAFGCPARDTYGMVEAVAAASECSQGSLHLWPEVGTVEVLHDERDEAVPDGCDGRLVCTGLLNDDAPLIRYEVGDRGALDAGPPCPCGVALPRLRHVVGRLSDNLVSTDGRHVFQFDHVFHAVPVVEAQIVQDAVGVLRVRVVPAEGFGADDQRLVAERLRERLGPVEVAFEELDRVPREANGKFKAVVRNV